jgi:hypothetical protein
MVAMVMILVMILPVHPLALACLVGEGNTNVLVTVQQFPEGTNALILVMILIIPIRVTLVHVCLTVLERMASSVSVLPLTLVYSVKSTMPECVQ